MELGRLRKVNIHHVYLRSTPANEPLPCSAEREQAASHAGPRYCDLLFCLDFSGKSKDSCENRTENPVCGPAS